MSQDQIARLRDKRGDEQVTFGDVADHLRDYTDITPEHGDVVQRLAAFLADVEDEDHRHEADPEHGLG